MPARLAATALPTTEVVALRGETVLRGETGRAIRDFAGERRDGESGGFRRVRELGDLGERIFEAWIVLATAAALVVREATRDLGLEAEAVVTV
jgi:hypothetical protein